MKLYIEDNGKYLVQSVSKEMHDLLPPGVYEYNYDQMSKTKWFSEVQFNHDEILDLPNPEYEFLLNEMTHFLKPTTKQKFKDFGFTYKRSSLLYGQPGTGKSCLVNRIADAVVKNKGIVIFNPNVNLIEQMYTTLNVTNKDTLVLVVLEELDGDMRNKETTLLSILDGQVQRENVIYLGTTNYIDRIPARLKRPGRFSTLLEMQYPNAEVRAAYLKKKFGDNTDVASLVERTDGLSIDDLKEVTLSTICLNQDTDTVIARIKEAKSLPEEEPKNKKYSMFGEDGDSENPLDNILTSMLTNSNRLGMGMVGR